MKRRLPFLIFLLTCFLPAAVFAQDEGAAGRALEAARLEIFDAVNELREEYNCGTLTFDSHLTTAAQQQAEYLAELGKLDTTGRQGESARERAMDAGYGGDKSFSIEETTAMVWVDTDTEYLIENVWRTNQKSTHAIFNSELRQCGIGIADAADKHRYIVLMVAGLDDGTTDYSPRPTYDSRTPKPTMSATPTPQMLITSTPNPDGGVYHVVQEGETFSEIAMAYGLDWYTLSVLNNIKLPTLTPVVIYEGEVLVIHPTNTATMTPTPTRTPLPPTSTPRPTYTPAADTSSADGAGLYELPVPNIVNEIADLSRHKRTVGIILVCLCVPGLIISLRKRK